MKPSTKTIQIFEMTMEEESDILLGKIKPSDVGIEQYIDGSDDFIDRIDRVKLVGEDFFREVWING